MNKAKNSIKSKAKSSKKSRENSSCLEGYNKNLDNIKLLISHPSFREDTKKIRNYLNIPEKGFKDNAEKSRTWYRKMTALSDEIIDKKEFFNQENRIRKKYREKEIGYRMAEKQMHLLWHKVPVNYLTDSINFLIEKFNLPLNYENFLSNYIIHSTYKNFDIPQRNFAIGGRGYSSNISPWKARFVSIIVYAKLNDKELIDLKEHIEHFGKKVPKLHPLKNIDKRLTLEKWFLDRERFDELEQENYKIKTGEIAKEVFGNSNKRSKKKVYDDIKELKKLRENRFGK